MSTEASKTKTKRPMTEAQQKALLKMREALEVSRKARAEAKAKLDKKRIDDDKSERLEKVAKAKKLKESLDIPDGITVDVKPKQKRGRKVGERIPFKTIPKVESDEDVSESEDEVKEEEHPRNQIIAPPNVYVPPPQAPTMNPYIFLMRQKKRR
jgi:hypothetical protein